MKAILPIAAASFLSITCLFPVFANDAENAQPAAKEAGTATQASVQASAKEATQKATDSVQQISRVSKIIGAAVISPNGESLGTINDLILNPESNQVSYAVVSYGGLLGMGDKLFGMPWNAMQWNNDNSNYVINVDKAVLAKSPGFDAAKWPNSLSEFEKMDKQVVNP